MLGIIKRIKRNRRAQTVDYDKDALAAFYMASALADDRYTQLRVLQREYAELFNTATRSLPHLQYLRGLDLLDLFKEAI